jgi:hypothetical protein
LIRSWGLFAPFQPVGVPAISKQAAVGELIARIEALIGG